MASTRWIFAAAAAAAVVAAATACSTTPSDSADHGKHLEVVASINAWGSIAAQLGGDHIHLTSIISNPDTDPHDYEPSTQDARTVAGAGLVIANGAGYDTWMDKLVAANPTPNRQVLTVAKQVGLADDGNPHQWYAPDSVAKVVDAITADLKKADPADAAFFDKQRESFVKDKLAGYRGVIADIKAKYAGAPIAASESIVEPMAAALGLTVVTPPSFLKSTSEGTDPSPADKSAIDRQIAEKQISVYIVNSQNSTPDVQAQVDAARKHGIPVVEVTETLSPAGASFQDWQGTQLAALAAALHTATGK